MAITYPKPKDPSRDQKILAIEAAIVEVLADKPLRLDEILKAVQALIGDDWAHRTLIASVVSNMWQKMRINQVHLPDRAVPVYELPDPPAPNPALLGTGKVVQVVEIEQVVQVEPVRVKPVEQPAKRVPTDAEIVERLNWPKWFFIPRNEDLRRPSLFGSSGAVGASLA